MSIAQLKKVSIAGSIQDLETIIRGLQRFGRAHLIDPNNAISVNTGTQANDTRASEALHYVSNSNYSRHSIRSDSNFKLPVIVNKILDVKSKLRHAEEEFEKVIQRIKIVEPWGGFTFPPEDYVEKLRFWFYILPLSKKDSLESVTIPWQIVGRSNTVLFVVLIAPTEPVPEILPVKREHLGSHSLKELLVDKEILETKIDELMNQRISLTRYTLLIQQSIAQANNEAFYEQALELCTKHAGFFTLQFWLASDDLSSFKEYASEFEIAYLSENPLESETPPTLLKPNKNFRSGALLAKIYQMPSYRSWDPSAHIYIFFSIFFAMIIADAGYGLIILAALLLVGPILKNNAPFSELKMLIFVMSISSIVWGVLVGSFFGFEPQVHWLGELHLIDLSNYQQMMAVSIGVGVGHICLANLTGLSIHNTSKGKKISKLGWSGIAILGYVIWLLKSSEPYPLSSFILFLALTACVVLVFIGEGWRKISDFKSIVQFVLSGMLSLTQLTKLFGDVLSYMRLFALGLASSSLALTFNQLSSNNMHQGGLALMFGVVIFVIGHLINFALGIMGGVVHGLRLNFIEFYNWSDPGEGYPFTAFRYKDLVNE